MKSFFNQQMQLKALHEVIYSDKALGWLYSAYAGYILKQMEV